MPKENSLENPMAIIGDEDIVSGFKALGFQIYGVRNEQEINSALEEVVRRQIAVCLVQADFYRGIEETIKNYRNLVLPVFLPFSRKAETDLLERIVKDIRIKATGAF